MCKRLFFTFFLVLAISALFFGCSNMSETVNHVANNSSLSTKSSTDFQVSSQNTISEGLTQNNFQDSKTNCSGELNSETINFKEKEQYEQIKSAIDRNSEYIIRFSAEKYQKGDILFDLNCDGVCDKLEYSTTIDGESDFQTVKKCTIRIGNFSIEQEYTDNYEVLGGISFLSIVDVNKSDNSIEFYISEGELADRVSNTFYRLSGSGIEKVCTINSAILGFNGNGQIYFWEGCLYDQLIGNKQNPDLVIIYYDVNSRKYAKTSQIIGKTLTAAGRILVYKANEDVVFGAPMNENDILEMQKDSVIRILDKGERFTVIQIDEKNAYDTYEDSGEEVIFFSDNGIKIRTEDGIEGWIGGFHMVWD